MSQAVECGPMEELQDSSDIEVQEEVEDCLQNKIASYVHAISEASDSLSSVWMEHSYSARWRGGKSPKGLLVRKPPFCSDCHPYKESGPIDVVSLNWKPDFPAQTEPTPHLEGPLSEEDVMHMCDIDDEWEEKIHMLAPTESHKKLIEEAIEVVESMRLSRLSGSQLVAGVSHAASLRRILAPHWSTIAGWLHTVLTAHLPHPLLTAYNEILSHLQRKIPHLMERLQASHIPKARLPLGDVITNEVLPLDLGVVMIPSGRDKMDERWEKRLRTMLSVHRIKAPSTPEPVAISQWVYSLYMSARQSVSVSPNGQALIGVGAGAALATSIATSSVYKPCALILISMPLATLSGVRGEPSDCLMKVKVPTLFIVPQNGMQCMVSDAGEICSRMSCITRVVVIGGADDYMRLSYKKQRWENCTQTMIELAIVKQIVKFLKNVLTEPRNSDSSFIDLQVDAKGKKRDSSGAPASKKQKPDTSSNNISETVIVHKDGAKSNSWSNQTGNVDTGLAHNIMEMPIVFADDESQQISNAKSSEEPMKLDSQSINQIKYKKVIIAKRPIESRTISKISSINKIIKNKAKSIKFIRDTSM